MDIAVDCGRMINPERIRSQMEGACVMGLGNAMFSEISFKNGRVEQGNFHKFEIVRMSPAPNESPCIWSTAGHVPLGGVGEPGVPPIAPAMCNAIFAATGKRIRNCRFGINCRVGRRREPDGQRRSERPAQRAAMAPRRSAGGVVQRGQTWGTAPRAPGAMLALREDGVVIGSVSGGCVEDDLIARLHDGRIAPTGRRCS